MQLSSYPCLTKGAWLSMFDFLSSTVTMRAMQVQETQRREGKKERAREEHSNTPPTFVCRSLLFSWCLFSHERLFYLSIIRTLASCICGFCASADCTSYQRAGGANVNEKEKERREEEEALARRIAANSGHFCKLD